MFRPSILAAVIACTAALLAPPAYAQPTSPPPPPPDGPLGPPGPPPAPYSAQPGPYTPEPEPAPPAFERSGWFMGFGLGVGGIGEERGDSWGGAQLNAYFGGLISRRLGLVVEIALGSYEVQNYDYDFDYRTRQRSLTTLTIGGQVLLSERLWLRAGLGSTRSSFGDDYNDVYGQAEGRSFTLAAGYEILRRRSLAVDLNLSMVATSYDGTGYGTADTTGGHVGAGFSWY